jgi:hypothetical protein
LHKALVAVVVTALRQVVWSLWQAMLAVVVWVMVAQSALLTLGLCRLGMTTRLASSRKVWAAVAVLAAAAVAWSRWAARVVQRLTAA